MNDPRRPDIISLERHLLRFGGHSLAGGSRLNVDLEPAFVRRLLEAGSPVDGRSAKIRRGGMRPSECHENSKWLEHHFKGYRAWTGVALSEDGAWRVHSWCLNTAGGIVETTEPRLVYYGRPASEDPGFYDL